MTKYINAEKLKAEIGRLKENVRNMEEWQSLCEVLSFIDSLQQKQSPLPANLDEVQQSVVSIAEKDGQQWVRVRVGDEDFLITAHDYEEDGKVEFTWNKACKIGTFTRKQALIACAFLDEINGKLREIGGEELASRYWSSTEYSATNAWNVVFSSGTIYGNSKYNTLAVRPVAAF